MSQPAPQSESPSVTAEALAALAREQSVRFELPGGGSLQLDGRRPILCVYRRASEDVDDLSEQLATAEAAHLVMPRDERGASQASQVLRALVANLAHHFGTFLLIEIWNARRAENVGRQSEPGGDAQLAKPRFEIVAPVTRIPRVTAEALSKSMGSDSLPFQATRVSLSRYSSIAPPGMRPLVRLSELKQWNGYVLGLVVPSIDRSATPPELVVAATRAVAREVHCALDHAYFAFVQQRKSLRPAHYHAPEQISVDTAVLEVDRRLAEIDRSFDLLLQATPVNAESAWREFRRSRFEKPPVFIYRPAPMDPVLLKRQLYLIPVERIENPTLSYLFRQKQDELDRQITLLSDVDTPRFLPESMQTYGGVSDWLLQHARELLDSVPKRSRRRSTHGRLGAIEFAKRAQQELGYYQQQCGDFSATVAVREDMYAGMMVSGSQLLIGGRTRVPRRRIDALLQHEIGTHLITRYNGHLQPFQQLEVGLAGYDGLQEGLAVLAEYFVGGLSRFRIRTLAARVVAAHLLLGGAPFVDTYRVLHRDLAFSPRAAYTIAMRVYRGGGLTKDAVYLRGLLQILRYLREGGELEPLYVGKVASAHLPLISELSRREILRPPALRPRYFERPDFQQNLDRLRRGMKPLDLVQ